MAGPNAVLSRQFFWHLRLNLPHELTAMLEVHALCRFPSGATPDHEEQTFQLAVDHEHTQCDINVPLHEVHQAGEYQLEVTVRGLQVATKSVRRKFTLHGD